MLERFSCGPHSYRWKLTPVPPSPRRCCPWSWMGCWQGCRMKTTWLAAGSAGSGANAGVCCPALTDTGSFSGHSTQLEKACTEFRLTLVTRHLRSRHIRHDIANRTLCGQDGLSSGPQNKGKTEETDIVIREKNPWRSEDFQVRSVLLWPTLDPSASQSICSVFQVSRGQREVK